MLPRVKINFKNGALGSTSPSADCVVGLICTGVAVPSKLELGKAYILHKFDDLADLGVTAASDDANAFLYKQVREFYAQVGDGAELWLMVLPNTELPSEICDIADANAYGKKLIQEANGRLRCLAVAYKPASDYSATITNGLDSDVMVAAQKAQALALWATTSLYAPLFVVIAGRGYSNTNITALPDLGELNYNRVGILIGDTVSGSEGAAIGVLAGRIAACPVQRHIGRVKDGALNLSTAYIGDKDATQANVETINDKGFITFRTFTGKSGYFFADDSLATAVADDYRSIARRRTIDKAYRITYATMLDNVNDEIPVTNEGKIVPAIAKAWETEVIANVVSQMAANGELGIDPNDDSDKGVKCYINPEQTVISDSQINVVVQVKPFGYSKYIDVELGFMTIKSEE